MTSPIKFQAFAISRNSILIRVENLDDLFDHPTGTTANDTTVYVDIKKFARDLYALSNGQTSFLNSISITELELAGI